MPSYPNQYGPANQIGAGLQNIARSIFQAGDYELDNRRIARQTDEQAALREAQAKLNDAHTQVYQQQAKEQELRNAGLTPEALSQHAADSVNMPAQLYNQIVSTPDHHFDQDLGPAPGARFAPADVANARRGRSMASYFLQNQNPNPEQFAKAGEIQQRSGYLDDVMKGLTNADAFGDAVAAAEGKPRYNMESGVQYSNQVGGRTAMTPLGDAKVAETKANIGAKNAQAGADNARARLAGVQADAGGFAPRAPGAADKRVAVTKNDNAIMENQLADLVSAEFKKIDPESRARIISHASSMFVDPESDFHRDAAGAMEQAVAEMAPNGFEDSAGMLSKARFVPKGGLVSPQVTRPASQPAPRQPAPRQPTTRQVTSGGGLPQQARAALREGVHTRFANGQTWTLQGGSPVRIQ